MKQVTIPLALLFKLIGMGIIAGAYDATDMMEDECSELCKWILDDYDSLVAQYGDDHKFSDILNEAFTAYKEADNA